MQPGNTQVMEPVLGKILKNRDNTIYQVKWDGVRMLSFIEEGQVILQNRRGRIKTKTFPELKCLAALSNQPMVIDGEVFVVKDGRPDFSMILRRNFTDNPRPGAVPVSYVVFDILRWQGKDLRNVPLAKRQKILADIQLPPGPVTVIDNFRDGEKLFQHTAHRGWEGIVAKDINSPYVSGKSPYWQKYKHKQKGLFFIVGYVTNQGQLASLLLARDFGDGLVLTGSVGSGFSNAGRKFMQDLLSGFSLPAPPVPVKGKQANWFWVKPLLQAEVEFMEWTEDITLRAPVFKALMLEGKRIELP